MRIAAAATARTPIITMKPVLWANGIDAEGDTSAVGELVFSTVISVTEPLAVFEVFEAEDVLFPVVVAVDKVDKMDDDFDADAVKPVDCTSVAVFTIPSCPITVSALPPSAAKVPSPVSQLQSPSLALDPQQNLLLPQDIIESLSESKR